MAVDVLLGLQWGDEGKGKIVDHLSDQYDAICRFQGGPNAGHTIIIGNDKHVLHTIPSGVFRAGIKNIVGNGVVIDPITFEREINGLLKSGLDCRSNLYISKKAHLILPTHRYLDAASEAQKGDAKIGSTLRGIGPTYMDKTGRNGLRIGDLLTGDFRDKYQNLKKKHLNLAEIYPKIDFDLEGEEDKWFKAVETLKQLQIIDGEYFINDLITNGKKVLAEGAQGSMLDITYGTYPFVTSSNTITAGVCTGLGIPPQAIRRVIGITKAYCTRVGSGPFPTELFGKTGNAIMKEGKEYGATTGRERRCGWIDLPQLKYVIMLNGVTELVITKLDVLTILETFNAGTAYQFANGNISNRLPFDLIDEIKKVDYQSFNSWNQPIENAKNYDELPTEALNYLDFLERELNTPIKMVSVGPERNQTIIR
ncbi:MAG: adenylosuccinate synthase [Saprospirales bacterium]|nr:MAG: adenylosuccinate synthase [Saprospirales bacterium]